MHAVPSGLLWTSGHAPAIKCCCCRGPQFLHIVAGSCFVGSLHEQRGICVRCSTEKAVLDCELPCKKGKLTALDASFCLEARMQSVVALNHCLH